MGKTAPVVTDGMSSLVREAPKAEQPAPRPSLTEGERPAFPTRFSSLAERLTIYLNIRDPLPDGSYKDHRFNVSFEDHFLDIEKHKAKYPKTPQRVSEAIQALPNYGIGGTFWDYDEAQRLSADARKQATLDHVAALDPNDPEVRDALRKQFGEDFFEKSA